MNSGTWTRGWPSRWGDGTWGVFTRVDREVLCIGGIERASRARLDAAKSTVITLAQTSVLGVPTPVYEGAHPVGQRLVVPLVSNASHSALDGPVSVSPRCVALRPQRLPSVANVVFTAALDLDEGGSFVNSASLSMANCFGCGSLGVMSCCPGEGAVEVAGLVDALSFLCEVELPVCREVVV